MTDILSEMEVRDGSIKGSAIVSWDAFFITGALEKSINENLVASIAATLISIGQIAVESTGIGELEEVGIMSKQGLIFVSRISNEFLLATFASPNARLRLGMIFSLIAKTADSVRKLSKSAKQ
jgi:predicted regulator of Ras-like GTPase activity (Roadblock/LC7/MglB family)